jgi:hypothetical protein
MGARGEGERTKGRVERLEVEPVLDRKRAKIARAATLLGKPS